MSLDKTKIQRDSIMYIQDKIITQKIYRIVHNCGQDQFLSGVINKKSKH